MSVKTSQIITLGSQIYGGPKLSNIVNIESRDINIFKLLSRPTCIHEAQRQRQRLRASVNCYIKLQACIIQIDKFLLACEPDNC